ncbi:unnamed protein product [Acanthoscelides obtectus]|uniref:Uncharacterized protein n=1 Tax=Acanthoscelides obtectus TaxID=200917 RepID=A0A9P0KT91_ACAOB|nr:unnamed protein product [Acanthoscelides obtectus]CAK1637723.1 hypothetical protein AOBTE_LOCUS10151 [Acanthoscelides obtectus]
MSIRERLEQAYENAAFGADETWSSGFHSLQRPNMDLLLRERQIKDAFDGVPHPRAVNDCIPGSKLATYFDYSYSPSRELSYAGNFIHHDCAPQSLEHDISKDPWMSEIVEHNLMEHLTPIEADRKSFQTKPQLESPFLKVGYFLEHFIRIALDSKAVKRLWETNNLDKRSFMYCTPSPRPGKSLVVYKPPMGEVLVREHDNDSLSLEDTKKAYEKDENHLKLVESSWKQHQEQQEIHSNETQTIACTNDSSQSKRLYSAVLQGYSSNKDAPPPPECQMTILKRTVPKKDRTVDSTSNIEKKKPESSTKSAEYVPVWRQSEQTKALKVSNQTTLVRSTPAFTPTTSSEGVASSSRVLAAASHLIPQINAARLLASAFVSASQVGAVSPLAPQSLLRLCHPALVRRPIQNAVTTRQAIPRRAASNILAQNQFQPSTSHQRTFKPKAKTKRHIGCLKKINPSATGTVKKNTKVDVGTNNHASRNGATSGDVERELDELVLRVVEFVLSEPESENVFPVTGSLSDELERQALEQYSNSNDNVFQELERQAVEEYEGCSENCKSPPNCKGLFGGFFNINFFIL